MRSSLLRYLVPALLSLSLATIASGQATRTWVSGVGDDANPCSRTAPCKTFQGAISKTAPGGEIDALDPGGFGGVTITKAMTIDGQGTFASILAAGTSGIIINAGANDVINIRNLSINGVGTGTNGIRVLAGKAVHIEGCQIVGFAGSGATGRGLSLENSTNMSIYVLGSVLRNNANAGLVAVSTSLTNRLYIDDSHFDQNGQGMDLAQNINAVLRNSTFNNNTQAGAQIEASTVNAHFQGCSLSQNSQGIQTGVGGSTPTVRISLCQITGNTTNGLLISSGFVRSHGNNAIAGNVGNEAPSSVINTQ